VIDRSYLLGLYGVSSTTTPQTTAASLIAAGKKPQPTPPWSPTSKAPMADALVRGALSGRRLVNESAASIDVAGASADYKKLFSLYQGLRTLSALADRAGTKNVGASETAQLMKRFTEGLAEIGSYVSGLDLDKLRLVQGTTTETSKTTAAVARDSTTAISGVIHEGATSSPVAAFAGDVRFGITIKVPAGQGSTTTTVPIDLTGMGSTPRSLDNVITFINTQLNDAGFATRITRQAIAVEAKTITANGKVVSTLPAGPDRWALAVNGTATETVGFAAAQTSDAVYVVQGVGAAGGHQLLKFQSDGGDATAPTGGGIGENLWVEGRVSQTNLPEGVTAIRASAIGPDGSLWLVGDLSAGPGNQPIKGVQDVALMKYDSSGRLLMTRTLGAASTASGYAIAIDANGDVAVAGSVTGALNTSSTDAGKGGAVATVADSFVTVFDAAGEEKWTQRRGARAADEATAVAFGADGAVYVSGRAQSAIPGTVAIGGWDGYVQAFSATQAYPGAPVTPQALAATQFGTAGDDNVQAMTIDGSSLYTAGVENGRIVIRQFSLGPNGATSLAATRDLGVATGEVAGISVVDGKVVVAGTTRNTALSVGTVTQAHAGGTDVFVATLSGDLSPSGDERLTYFGGAGDDTAADVKVHDGKVWLTGVSDRPAGAKDTDLTKAYLARLDPLTGAVEYNRVWTGEAGQAKASTLAVATNGASVLDRLGLPNGEITQNDSKLLTAATALRPGDRFYITPADGGRSVAVTIDAKDTLATLARKIEQASNNKLKVTVLSESGPKAGEVDDTLLSLAGLQRLSITARSGRTGAVLTAGEAGRDALGALGLSPGLIGPTKDVKIKTYGLDLPSNLSLSNADLIKTATEKLTAAMKVIRDAYKALDPATAAKKATSGPVPAYLSNQIANYQAALDRLTG